MAQSASLELAFGTPTLVSLDDGRDELVIGVPNELLGLNPETGKFIWYATTGLSSNICPSVVADRDILFTFGGRSGGSRAVRAGGKGDVTESHTVWDGRYGSYVATPLFYEGHLYWIDDRGQAFCIKADSGDLVYRERVPDVQSGGRPFYASPVLADGKLYVVSRWNGTFVLAARPEFELLAQNRLESDESDFNATPAIGDGRLYLRSDKFLYCIAVDDRP
jgi:outer membrane protein assembly factor BamB